MPSIDERREVAARLRELEETKYWERDFFSVEFTNAIMGMYADALGIERRASVGEFLERLADLIEPQEHICLGCIKWSAIEGNPVKGACAEFSHPEDGIERATPYYGYCNEWEGE